MTEDKLNVTFLSERSKHDNCFCKCCHGTGEVLKLRIPTTLYHDGRKLTTKYNDLWICDKCREKMITALKEDQHDGD